MPRKPKSAPVTPETVYWYHAHSNKRNKVRFVGVDEDTAEVTYTRGSTYTTIKAWAFIELYDPVKEHAPAFKAFLETEKGKRQFAIASPSAPAKTIFQIPTELADLSLLPTPEQVRATVEAQSIAPGDLKTVVEPNHSLPDDVQVTFTEQPEIPAPRPPTLEDIARHLNLKTRAAINAFHIAVECLQTLDAKQLDYGPGNISAFGELGVLVRTNDKIERLKHLQKSQSPKNESIDDSWLDITNYGLIAQLLRRGLWE